MVNTALVLPGSTGERNTMVCAARCSVVCCGRCQRFIESIGGGLCNREYRIRDGALVPVIETFAETAIPLWRLVAERALYVNTTAAGGNASLMTLGG